MNLCLVMIGRFEKRDDGYYGDMKNINAIERYLEFFDNINVVARITDKNGLYPRQKINLKKGRISFSLYEENNGIERLWNKAFTNVLVESIQRNDFVLCWAEPRTTQIIKNAKKSKKPCMVYVGGCNRDTLLSSKSLFRKVVAYYIYFSNRWGIYNADYVHYVTNSELQKRYPTRGISVGASYVNVKLDIDAMTKKRRFERYDNLEKKIVLGVVGYLNQVKGIDTAIEALAKLESRFVLKVLGGGERYVYENLAIKYGVQSRVHFEGTLEPGKQVLNWLDGIDVYLQPSRTEGLPRATIEAMSRGCPVVSSNVMGLKELVPDELRHKPGDSAELALLVKDLTGHPEKLKEQAQRSFDVAANYDRRILDKRIEKFFKQILSNEQVRSV